MRVAPLVILLKDWSKYCGINNAPAGYLSSYSIVLMVIFFLQCKSAGYDVGCDVWAAVALVCEESLGLVEGVCNLAVCVR